MEVPLKMMRELQSVLAVRSVVKQKRREEKRRRRKQKPESVPKNCEISAEPSVGRQLSKAGVASSVEATELTISSSLGEAPDESKLVAAIHGGWENNDTQTGTCTTEVHDPMEDRELENPTHIMERKLDFSLEDGGNTDNVHVLSTAEDISSTTESTQMETAADNIKQRYTYESNHEETGDERATSRSTPMEQSIDTCESGSTHEATDITTPDGTTQQYIHESSLVAISPCLFSDVARAVAATAMLSPRRKTEEVFEDLSEDDEDQPQPRIEET